NLTGDGNPEKLSANAVSSNFFSVLGVSPVLGRDFRTEDNVPGAAGVAILSNGLWLRRFGGRPEIVGETMQLNGEKYAVVGIMPAGFLYPDRKTELWVPWRFTNQMLANHGSHYLQVIARLKPQVSLQ